ncbi:MAG: hypothetical protein EBQ94_04985 [Flavobacteriales bacterium]|nr:hypothetical protein [Flavobacteriales bacterium]NCA20049.1 hypothetical protein [Crocinitomicaceae bacterium]
MSYLKFKLILSNRCRYYTKQVFFHNNVLVNWYYFNKTLIQLKLIRINLKDYLVRMNTTITLFSEKIVTFHSI